MEFSAAENVALPHLLRNNIFATSTVADPSAEAGAITYELQEPRYWIVRNTSFQWNGTISLASGGSQDFNMTNAFQIRGPDAAGKTWTLSQSVDDSSIATVSINGKTATVNAADDLTAAGNTNFYLLGSDGNFVEVYTGYVEVAAMVSTPATITPKNAQITTAGITYSGPSDSATVLADLYLNWLTDQITPHRAEFEPYYAGTYTIPVSSLFNASGPAEIYQIGSGTSWNDTTGGVSASIVNGNLQLVITGGMYDSSALTTIHARLTGSPATTASIPFYVFNEAH